MARPVHRSSATRLSIAPRWRDRGAQPTYHAGAWLLLGALLSVLGSTPCGAAHPSDDTGSPGGGSTAPPKAAQDAPSGVAGVDQEPPAEGRDAPGDLEAEPELISFVEADYPADALRQGIEGTVVLDLVIGVDGAVDSVAVVRGVDSALDRAAADAARGFRFTPAVLDGEPIPVILQYHYTFSIRARASEIAERVNFRGTLRERGTRRPIADAVVALTFPDSMGAAELPVPWSAYLERLGEFSGQFRSDPGLVAYTDSLGRFAFTSLPPGAVQVAFPNAGYEPATYEETIGPGELLEVDYWLQRAAYDEFELVVYGKPLRKEVTRQTLQLAEIERIPGLGGDAIRVVQTLPGVARPSFVSGDVIVRGSAAEDTRYYLDGIDIPLLFHFGGLKSTYNSQALESIDLYPGGFNTRYGGCVGGVVEIKGRPGRTDRWRKTIDVNLLDASGLLEGPLARTWSLTLAGRRSYITNAFSLIEGMFDDVDLSVVPYYWDVVGRVDYTPNARDRLFFTVFSVGDAMRFVFDDVEGGSSEVNEAKNELSMDYRFDRLLFGYDKHLGRSLNNELRLSAGWDTYQGRFLGFARYDYDFATYSLRDQLSWKASDRLTYNVGLDLYEVPLDYEVHVVGAGHTKLSKTYADLAAYTNVALRPTDRLRVIPGVRYDHFRELKTGRPGYRLTMQYQLDRDRMLKAAAGTYSQSPRPLGQAIDPVFGNPSLPPTEAVHYTVGGEWQISDLLSANLDLYYNTQEKIPNLTDDPDVNFLPDMDARMYGFEVMLRHHQGRRFFGWLSYSLSRSERRSPRRPDASIQGEWDPDQWVVSEYDQTHHLQLVGSYLLGRNWTGGLRVRYVTGNPITPRLGHSAGQYEFDADSGEYVSLQGAFRSQRMDPFFQIDLRVDKRWIFKTWMLTTYVDIQNLNYFVYNSPEFYAYGYDDSERKAIGGIVLPSIGVRAEF